MTAYVLETYFVLNKLKLLVVPLLKRKPHSSCAHAVERIVVKKNVLVSVYFIFHAFLHSFCNARPVCYFRR